MSHQETSTFDIYRTTAPTTWAQPPSMFSFSSLSNMEACPLRWQLERSTYGPFERFPIRSNPKAAIGTLIHELLDELFKELTLEGVPEKGTPAFRDVVKNFGLLQKIHSRLKVLEDEFFSHPRGYQRSFQWTPRQLQNKLIRLFTPQYTEAESNRAQLSLFKIHKDNSKKSAGGRASTSTSATLLQRLKANTFLSEQHLRHPTLPIRGIVDLIRWKNEEVSIIDFKTGVPKENHKEQVLLYALFFYRETGVCPNWAEVVYTNEIRRYEVSTKQLLELEVQLGDRVSQVTELLSTSPAKAIPNQYCRFCDVRALCGAFWEQSNIHENEQSWIDLEITLSGETTANGFVASTKDGDEVTVVYKSQIASLLSHFEEGQVVRILGARKQSNKPVVVELHASTEVFHM